MSNDLISREALRRRMYHEAFETDNGMQKWDSGLWVRYKIFENVIEETPAVDFAEVVRCKDCKYFYKASKYCSEFMTANEDGFCAWGERMEDNDE